jgi:hypothetical protein
MEVNGLAPPPRAAAGSEGSARGPAEVGTVVRQLRTCGRFGNLARRHRPGASSPRYWTSDWS